MTGSGVIWEAQLKGLVNYSGSTGVPAVMPGGGRPLSQTSGKDRETSLKGRRCDREYGWERVEWLMIV